MSKRASHLWLPESQGSEVPCLDSNLLLSGDPQSLHAFRNINRVGLLEAKEHRCDLSNDIVRNLDLLALLRFRVLGSKLKGLFLRVPILRLIGGSRVGPPVHLR